MGIKINKEKETKDAQEEKEEKSEKPEKEKRREWKMKRKGSREGKGKLT